MNDAPANQYLPIVGELVWPEDTGARYVEYMVGMHGALLEGSPSLGDAIDHFACDAPVIFGRAAWGYDAEQARGWFQIAAGSSADERAADAAAFDRDMRRRGLVPIAPTFLR